MNQPYRSPWPKKGPSPTLSPLCTPVEGAWGSSSAFPLLTKFLQPGGRVEVGGQEGRGAQRCGLQGTPDPQQDTEIVQSGSRKPNTDYSHCKDAADWQGGGGGGGGAGPL